MDFAFARTLTRGLVLGLVLVLSVPFAALADNVVNDVVGTLEAYTGDVFTVSYRIVATGGDGKTGCNASTAFPVTVTPVLSAGLTANPTSLTFVACGTGTDQDIEFTASTDGIKTVTVGVTGGQGTFNVTPGAFTVSTTTPDGTPPTITASVSGTPGSNGWYTSDVTVTWTVVDNESTLSSQSGCGPTTISTDTAGQTLTCTATSAGGTASESVTIMRDATDPTITGSADPGSNPSGWNNTSVDVSFDCDDSMSGVASCDGDTTVTAEGDTTVTGTATDYAGRTATADVTVRIDKTAPGISGTPDRAPNADGWYKAGVTVSFACSDDRSGVDSCAAPVTLSGEGADQSASGDALDKAGNTASTTVSNIDIDLTAPVISDFTVAPLKVGATLSATFAAVDALSGLDGTSYTLDGSPETTAPATPGVHELCLVARDKAGNESTACAPLAVYDPAAGFVTGGGWISSPAGAYAADGSLAGKATFGFVSKYQKGANVPTGNTEFQFHVAKFNFKSTDYEWLVIAGGRAQYKGNGTVNGAGSYGFILTAVDGDSGAKKPDLFRIKIWDRATGNTAYDNQMGAADGDAPTTALGGGSIQIQAK